MSADKNALFMKYSISPFEIASRSMFYDSNVAITNGVKLFPLQIPM